MMTISIKIDKNHYRDSNGIVKSIPNNSYVLILGKLRYWTFGPNRVDAFAKLAKTVQQGHSYKDLINGRDYARGR